MAGCGLWVSGYSPGRPAAGSVPGSQPGSSGSLWAAVEPRRPLLAASSGALSCLREGLPSPPLPGGPDLPSSHPHRDPQNCVWDFLGAVRGWVDF